MLHLAKLCNEGKLHEVRAAIARGANVNESCDTHITPLIGAVMGKHTSIVRLLLAQPELDVNAKLGMTPLQFAIAVAKDNSEPLRLLLADDRVDVNGEDYAGHTALQIAIAEVVRSEDNNMNTIAVKLLLANSKVDPNIVDRMLRLDSLGFAVTSDLPEVVRLLLANPRLKTVNQVDHKGMTPVMSAICGNRVKSLHVLASHPSVDLDAGLPVDQMPDARCLEDVAR